MNAIDQIELMLRHSNGLNIYELKNLIEKQSNLINKKKLSLN